MLPAPMYAPPMALTNSRPRSFALSLCTLAQAAPPCMRRPRSVLSFSAPISLRSSLSPPTYVMAALYAL
jgi:hypothetical protein